MPCLEMEILGRKWQLLRPGDLETIWEAIDNNFDAKHIPYWLEVWPACLGLCNWLNQQKDFLKDKVCLELGCGLGLSTLIAKSFNLEVIAVDLEKDALQFASKNANLNGVEQASWLVMDWCLPAIRKKSLPIIWGADILYERAFIKPLLNFFEHSLADDGKIWLADPGRGIQNSFLTAMLQSQKWQYSIVAEEIIKKYVPIPITVKIYELQRIINSTNS